VSQRHRVLDHRQPPVSCHNDLRSLYPHSLFLIPLNATLTGPLFPRGPSFFATVRRAARGWGHIRLLHCAAASAARASSLLLLHPISRRFTGWPALLPGVVIQYQCSFVYTGAQCHLWLSLGTRVSRSAL
jgi:hypothetical protein